MNINEITVISDVQSVRACNHKKTTTRQILRPTHQTHERKVKQIDPMIIEKGCSMYLVPTKQ